MDSPKPKWQLRSRILPLLVVLVLVSQLLTPYKGWMILLVGMGSTWLLSTLWTLSLARGLRLTREMRFGWVQVGDRLIERFALHNGGRFPALWIEIGDRSTLPHYDASRGTGVDGGSFIRWHKESICNRRGLFYLGPTCLCTGDPFGIYTLTWEYPRTMPLLVLPPIVPLPTIEVAPGGNVGEGRPRRNAFERTVAASTVRQYAPGDSRRFIHWKTSARRDELFVRLFDSTPAGDWWILLDMDRYVQVGEADDSTAELGVILAASLADRGIKARRPVGLMVHGRELLWLPPREGEGQRWEILRALALVKQGPRPLSELLARVRPMLGQRISMIIITASTDVRWVEDLVPLLRRGAVPTVLLLDPVSFGGERNIAPVKDLLAQLGVAHTTITHDLLESPEARPGRRGHWEYQVLGTGKVVPVRRSASAAWRPLG